MNSLIDPESRGRLDRQQTSVSEDSGVSDGDETQRDGYKRRGTDCYLQYHKRSLIKSTAAQTHTQKICYQRATFIRPTAK